MTLGARHADAENVATFTSATLEMESPPGGTPIPLDIDPNAPPEDTTALSLPPGSVARIRVAGTAAAAGGVGIHLMDLDDFSDDELDLQGTPFPLEAGAPFEITVFLICWSGSAEVGDSGEQSAEIYVVDGSKRIPADRDLGGGSSRHSWWAIDCDKQATQTLGAAGGTMQTPWGDRLHVPPGALAADVDVRMANMYPLLHAESVPPGSRAISEAQALEPDGLLLGAPATLTFLYTQEEAGEFADEASLRVYRYDTATQQWLPVPGQSVDPANNLLSVPITSFATYGFAAAVPPVPALSHRGLAVAFAVLLFVGFALVRPRGRRQPDSRSGG
jgi:hypothetical protein